ncbi:MAG: AAA family ATPase [Gammaproteobacteria bacterium]|nr:AAA family ATPase [Gammaproteobacteria bacterium]
MKLTSIQVKNYRSVEDSEKFAIDDITCLVGKNESGKTAILKAIEGINPFQEGMKYDKTTDYPRRYLSQYDERHSYRAEVCISEWKLNQKDIEVLKEEFGEDCLDSHIITITTYYEGSRTFSIQLNQKNVVHHLCNEKNLNAAEMAVIGDPDAVKDLYQKISESGTESEKLISIKEHIEEYRDKSAYLKAIDLLFPRVPSFVYFSYYSRMSGAISINQYRANKENNKVSENDEVFADFLSFAGTSIDEIDKIDKHEEFKSKIEAASNRITDQIFDYWTQNTNLEIEFEVSEGKESDPRPFNSGTVMRARVKNTAHRASVPFSERSAGFIWFFSFLVHFSQVEKHYSEQNENANVIVLLDEPGLTLHAKAQYDLLRYIQEKLASNYQVIYSTHSPFMVIPDQLSSIRTVEDVIRERQNGRQEILGTKVSSDFLKTSRDTIFPLQSALGYEISQTLFIGEKVLLVEGASDILYLKKISNLLKEQDRSHIEQWVLCPAGGIDKIAPFVSLYLSHGKGRKIVVLTDYQKGHKKKVQRLRDSNMMSSLLLYSDFCDKEEADVEDLFEQLLYLKILNHSCGVSIEPGNINSDNRILKEIESQGHEISHYKPADWLLRNEDVLREDNEEVNRTLGRFENLFNKINENQ